MGDLFLLSARQMARISPHFHFRMACRGSMIDEFVSGIVYVIRYGLQWKDAPKG